MTDAARDPQFASIADTVLETLECNDEVARVLTRLEGALGQILDELDEIRKQRRLPVRLVSAEPSAALAACQQRLDEHDRAFAKMRAAFKALQQRDDKEAAS
jgi:hypothetical protein